MSYLNDDQIAQLLRPINDRRVSTRDKMSYLESYDVRAHLDRIFGFARWSADLTDLTLLFETLSDDGKRVSVGYRATMRLTICAPDGTQLATYTEAATGDAVNFPINKRADAHDFGIKTAESQALKRCAINLGTQYGLSLYQNGTLKDIVGHTLISGVRRAEKGIDDDVEPVVPEAAEPPVAPDNHEQSTPPPKASANDVTNSDAKALRVADLTAQLLGATRRAEVAGITGQILKEGLGGALTYDALENALTLGALADQTLKRVVTKASA